ALEFGVPVFTDNAEAAAGADCVVLAVKPQVMQKACAGLAASLRMSNPLIISIAAGIRIAQIERLLGDQHAIVRWIEDEAQMDTVTAVSGSGPAYFFLLVEAMEDAAVQLGLPRDTARALA